MLEEDKNKDQKMNRQFTKKYRAESSTMDNSSEQGQLSEENIKAIIRMNESMQRVSEIPLVVEEIIDNLYFADLKSCRLVCRMWKETATKVMLKKDCSQVKIIYDNQIGKFRKELYDQKLLKKYNLLELTKIVQKSNTFPSSTFIIIDGNFGDSEMLDFFKAEGRRMKTLSLSSIVKTPLDILVYCPNVETLRLNLINMVNPTLIHIEFPQLKVLSLGFSSGFRLRNIITPNLQVIENFILARDTTDVVNAGKIHTIKTLKLYSSSEHTPPKKLQEFVNAGPQIETLTFCDFGTMVDEDWRRDFAGPFLQLLDTCRDTLKVLKFSGLGRLFENMTFPRFTQLRELQIWYCWGSKRIFPIRINLPETFPRLEIFDVSECRLREDVNWDMHFPPPDAYRGQLASVTRVKIRGNCSQKCREMFQQMCPNAIIVDRGPSVTSYH